MYRSNGRDGISRKQEKWMRKLGFLIAICLLGYCGRALAGGGAVESVREGPEVLPARATLVGERIEDVGFTDLAGKAGRLSDYKDKRALVVCLTGATCPVAQKYGPTIVELEKRFAPKGVAFVAVNCSTAESVEKIKAAAAEFAKAGWTG